MADIKIYGTLKNVTNNAIVYSNQVIGGYMALTQDEINNLSDALLAEGMFIYNKTDSKFYQYLNGSFSVVNFSSEIIIDDQLSLTSENPVQNKVITEKLNTKQDNLTTTQLNAVNSGITSAKVTQYDGYATSKQDKLTDADLGYGLGFVDGKLSVTIPNGADKEY